MALRDLLNCLGSLGLTQVILSRGDWAALRRRLDAANSGYLAAPQGDEVRVLTAGAPTLGEFRLALPVGAPTAEAIVRTLLRETPPGDLAVSRRWQRLLDEDDARPTPRGRMQWSRDGDAPRRA